MSRRQRCETEANEYQLGIRQNINALNLTAFFSKGEAEKSYGLSGRSYDGYKARGGSEPPIPVSGIDGGMKDPHDRTVDQENEKVRQMLRDAFILVDEVLKKTRRRGVVLDPESAAELARGELGENAAECARCPQIVKGSGRSDDRLYAAKNGDRVCFSCYRKDQRR